MKRRYPAVAVLLLASIMSLGAARAEKPLPSTKAEQLGKALGLTQMLDAAREQTRIQSKAQLDQVIEQLRGANVSPDYLSAASKFIDEYVRKVTNAWSSQEAASIFVSALAEGMTDAEIDEAIAYYSSPEGRKANDVVNDASGRLAEYITSKTSVAVEQEVNVFMAKITELAKKPPSKPKSE
jgi:hypothetical protein